MLILIVGALLTGFALGLRWAECLVKQLREEQDDQGIRARSDVRGIDDSEGEEETNRTNGLSESHDGLQQ